MIRIHLGLDRPGCAQGTYGVKAKGSVLAVLCWGDGSGPLPGWGPIAYVPIDPAGNGSFFFPGGRCIPEAADRVWARCYAADFASFEDASAEIPPEYWTAGVRRENARAFSVLTDLHLASKPWKVRRALRAAESGTVFLLGDSTNDGLREQFDLFEKCIGELAPEKRFFPVTGNHDVLHPSRDGKNDGCRNYADFQQALLAKSEGEGQDITYDPDGRAYALRIGDLDVIALQCVTNGRRFLFPEGRQIDWLERHLTETKAIWHILLCHAPLLKHNPNRNDGQPYLDRNRRIQEIVDRHGGIIFLSGHTHVSPNVLCGNGEYDAARRNIYLDCGSVVDTDTSREKGMMSPDWKDGVVTELLVDRDAVEICMRSVDTGIRFPRGCYRFANVDFKDNKW